MDKKKKPAGAANEMEKAPKSVSRRDALKRIARNTSGLAIMAALPSWALANKDEDDFLAYYYSYYSSYTYRHYSTYSSYRYYSQYYSLRSQYFSYASYGYSSYGSRRGGPGGTCFIDTLQKNKKDKK